LNFYKNYRVLFLLLCISKFTPLLLRIPTRKWVFWLFEGIVFVTTALVLTANYFTEGKSGLWGLLSGTQPLAIATLILIFSEFSRLVKRVNNLNIPPALLFALSFLVIIIVGTGLLLLPKAHYGQITALDALFTATSAVCVTGLTVVSTTSTFTFMGKAIILCLIQVGGLGIMAFTGFFGYVFTGKASFHDRFVLRDMLSGESLGNLFRTLTKIMLITFLTEMAGAFIIFVHLDGEWQHKLFFSVFHSVSAFCNAGFSTLPNGLNTPWVQHSYSIQVTILLLIVLGGIGFPVLLSVYRYSKSLMITLWSLLFSKRVPLCRLSDINARIVIGTSILLVIGGAAMYYLLEDNHSLNGLSPLRKVMVALFGSVSARTAGFNIVDITAWGYPTIFVMIMLMWIGASPGSTGGGIKTTTFTVALLSCINFIRGNHQLEISRREIGLDTIKRVLVVVFLSVIIISAFYLLLLITEPGKNPIHLLFEVVSAFGTVGLTLVDTSTLSEFGKLIIILAMYIGRIGPLTLLTGLFITQRVRYYRYPSHELIIN
jgi:potassium uptake TrkH family protein